MGLGQVRPVRRSCQLDLQRLPCIRPPPTLSAADPGPGPDTPGLSTAAVCSLASLHLPLPLSSFCTRRPEQVWNRSQAPDSSVTDPQGTPAQPQPSVRPVAPALSPHALPLSSPAPASWLLPRLPQHGPASVGLHLLFPLPACCSRSCPSDVALSSCRSPLTAPAQPPLTPA